MASVNKVVLIGNLGRDPEMRYLPSGDPVATFSLATTESWKDKSGQKKEETQWHQIEVFGKTAEIVRDYCTKGKQIYIEGTIKYDEWTDKDGVKKTKAKIKVSGPNSRVVLLSGPRDGGGGGGSRNSGGGETREAPPSGGDFQVSDDDVPF